MSIFEVTTGFAKSNPYGKLFAESGESKLLPAELSKSFLASQHFIPKAHMIA